MNLQLFGLGLMVLEFVGALLIICYAFHKQDRKRQAKETQSKILMLKMLIYFEYCK